MFDNDDSSINNLFSPFEKLFGDFEKYFSGYPEVLILPSNQDSTFDQQSNSTSNKLRDQVLKSDFNENNEKVDEDLDSDIVDHDLNRQFFSEDHSSFSSSSLKINRIERFFTSSGKCFLEKQIEQIKNSNENQQKETIRKVCGDLSHTTVRINGQIVREYGNSSMEELDRIDSNIDENQSFNRFNQIYSNLFEKLFS